MADSAADSLVGGAEGGVFVEGAAGLLACPYCFSLLARGDGVRGCGVAGVVFALLGFQVGVFDVLELCFPERGVRVRVGEADGEDGAAEAVGEIDPLGEGAGGDGEEEGAFSVAVLGVGVRGLVDGAGVGLEEGFLVWWVWGLGLR